MKKLFILFEHATGYALFKVIANEEIGALLAQVQESVSKLDRFGKVVKLLAFVPFKNAQQSLENILSVAEGTVHDDLKEFLQANIGSKADKIKIGVNEPKLAAAIQEALNVKCEYGETTAEIFRGIRLHFTQMVEGATQKVSETAQLGLGHSFSRSKVKFNINRADNMVIQSSALVEQLDKDINTFCMRIREWYSYHYPELYKIVNDNLKFTQLVLLIGNRLEFKHDENVDELLEIVKDKKIVNEIVTTLHISMGTDISDLDLINIKSFGKRVVSLFEYRDSLTNYLHKKMNSIAPNLTAIIGDNIGAKLISQAGSLTNLAKCPASTLQILGAEKALFRAIKTRGKTPKYGIIYHSSFISRAPINYKGRVSRLLAHKCSIASRIDCFQDQPNNIIGKCLNDQIEERLKYMQNPNKEDKKPRSNVDVIKEAVDKYSAYISKKKSKSGKRNVGEISQNDDSQLELPTKKKSKVK